MKASSIAQAILSDRDRCKEEPKTDAECFLPASNLGGRMTLPEPTIRVTLFGSEFAAVESPRLCVSATGPNCLKNVASQLLQAGFDPERELALYRAGDCIGRVLLIDAATGAT